MLDKKNTYVLTDSQETAIISYLRRNRISTYAEFLRDFSPRQLLETSPFDYESLIPVFFDADVEDVYEYEDFTKKSIYNQVGRMNIYNDNRMHYFTSRPRVYDEPITLSASREYCDAFLKLMFPEDELLFKYESSSRQGNEYQLLYMGLYNDTIISSNSVQFKVDSAGLLEIMCKLSIPTVPAGGAQDIYSADEALIVLADEAREIHPNNDIILNGMDLVYNQREDESGGNPMASPYYMFEIRAVGAQQSSTRVLIDAYTNTAIDWSLPEFP